MSEPQPKIRYKGLIQGDAVLYKTNSSSEPFRGQVIEFMPDNKVYVHFMGQNRRCDLTIDSSALQFVSHAPDPLNEPPRRGRKKKRSELEQRLWTVEEIMKYEIMNIRNIDYVEFYDYSIRAWYSSPYPSEFISDRKLFVCDICLKYYPSRRLLNSHLGKKHKCQYPPGFEIYRDDFNDNSISFFEIDGAKDIFFCQCLCLLGRLFLEDKCVFFDVSHFMFFVMATYDKNHVGHIVGFYSTDKSIQENIISCIVVLPQYQAHGYGKLLISLAYTIAKRKTIRGGPETPLSDLGTAAFKSYWRDIILTFIHNNGSVYESLDAIEISELTWILNSDVNEILKELDLFVKQQKGKHPQIDFQAAEILYDKYRNQMFFIKEENLIWLPPQLMPKLSSPGLVC